MRFFNIVNFTQFSYVWLLYEEILNKLLLLLIIFEAMSFVAENSEGL